MSVGKKIADIIEKKGLTQKEVAEKAGIKPQTLNNIITRDSSRADVQIFLKICDALNVPVSIFRDEALEEFYQDHPNAERIDENKKSPLSDFTENELQIVELFRQLTETQQGELIGRAKVMAEQNEALYKKEEIG